LLSACYFSQGVHRWWFDESWVQGDDIFLSKIFDPLLQHTLRLHETVPAPELRRRITSAAVMTAVALHSFSRRRNYFAEITAWTMFAAYVISASEKNGLDFSRDGQESVLTARDAIYDLLGQLCEELSENPNPGGGQSVQRVCFLPPASAADLRVDGGLLDVVGG
jgi:hypothetical protein